MPDMSQWTPQEFTNFLLAVAAIGCGIITNLRTNGVLGVLKRMSLKTTDEE